MEKIKKYDKLIYLITTTILLYLIIIILKSTYYSLFDVSLNKLTNTETLIVNITYQLFAITMSLTFLVKNKEKNLLEFKNYLKECKIASLTILIYAMTSIIELAVLYHSKTNIQDMSIAVKTFYLIISEALIILIIFFINKKTLIKNIKDMKKNWYDYFNEYLKYYIYSMIVMVISNIIIGKINPGIAGNEEIIRKTTTIAPVYMFFSSVIFAPFTEEMVFRKSIRRIIKNDLTFILTSGLIFGGLHVVGNITNILDLLYIIPYSAPGIAFAYILTKKDNVLIPLSIHILHNGLLMTLQLILLFI